MQRVFAQSTAGNDRQFWLRIALNSNRNIQNKSNNTRRNRIKYHKSSSATNDKQYLVLSADEWSFSAAQ